MIRSTKLLQLLFTGVLIGAPALFAFSPGPRGPVAGVPTDNNGASCVACHRTFAPANSDSRGKLEIWWINSPTPPASPRRFGSRLNTLRHSAGVSSSPPASPVIRPRVPALLCLMTLSWFVADSASLFLPAPANPNPSLPHTHSLPPALERALGWNGSLIGPRRQMRWVTLPSTSPATPPTTATTTPMTASTPPASR